MKQVKLINKYRICLDCGIYEVYAKDICKKCYKKLPDQREQSNKYSREWILKNKDHVSIWRKNYYTKNKDKILVQAKVYLDKNRDKINEKSKEYYWINKDSIREKQVAYRRKNKDKLNKNHKEWYELNKNNPIYKEKSKYRTRKWAKENRERVRELDRNYKKIKRKSDPSYRMRTNVSRHIRKTLRDSNGVKRSSIWIILPYTPNQLKKHLESQFKNGWNWDNYGSDWIIDHIIPQSVLPFDSIDHPNFIECWALKNLRPLDPLENSIKQNKILKYCHQ